MCGFKGRNPKVPGFLWSRIQSTKLATAKTHTEKPTDGMLPVAKHVLKLSTEQYPQSLRARTEIGLHEHAQPLRRLTCDIVPTLSEVTLIQARLASLAELRTPLWISDVGTCQCPFHRCPFRRSRHFPRDQRACTK